MQSLELKVPPLALVLLAGGFMWVVAWAAPAFGFAFPARLISAVGVIVIGIAIAGMGVFSFSRAKTTVNPIRPGRERHLSTDTQSNVSGHLAVADRLGHIPFERAGFPDSSWIRPVYESFPNRTGGKGACPFVRTSICDLS